MTSLQQAKAVVHLALKRSGGISKWARRFSMARSSIYDWIERGEVPPNRAVVIEKESHGLATRQELRPRDYWNYWPDLPRPNDSDARP